MTFDGQVAADVRRVVALLVDVEIVVWVAAGVLALSVGGVVQDFAGQFNVVVCELANLSIVDTQDLSFLGGAEGQAGDQVHDEEDEAGSAEGVGTSGDGVSELVAELHPVMVEPAAWNLGEAIEMCYVISGEEGCEDVADETTDGMFGKDIKSIIDTEDELELGGVVSTCGTDNTIDDCSPSGDEAGTWGNGNFWKVRSVFGYWDFWEQITKACDNT
jgi:hypothetical protein